MQDYLAQPEEIQERFFPFLCGINPNDLYAVNHLRRELETWGNHIYGIREGRLWELC